MIRPVEPRDIPVIADIGARAFRSIYDGLRRQLGDELCDLLRPDESTHRARKIRQHCEKHPQWCFVCEEEGRVVGYVTFKLDPERGIGTIGHNAVDPDCGLKGKGQEMYRAVLEHFRANGMRYASVTTGLDEAHAPARRAYERAGFNLRHDETTYYQKL